LLYSLFIQHPRQIAAALVWQLKCAGYDADDLAFLESAPGRQAIIDLHVRGIIFFVNAYSK